MEAEPSYTVLRIKRKATEPPLSSLVIQDGSGRAKKQRQINPLGKSRGVFRLAETVPETWLGRGEEGAVLRARIRGLLAGTPDGTATPPSPLAVPPQPQAAEPKDSSRATLSPTRDETSTKLEAQADASPDAVASPAPSASMATSSQPPSKQMKYRVVPPLAPMTQMMLPPRVRTYADENEGSPLNFVDAEAVSAGPSRKASLPSEEEQKEMAPFLSMLEDVLKFESPAKSSRKAASRNGGASEMETYVYDLYYRDNRPTASAALPLGVGDGVNIGALLGYDDIMDDDSHSESEPEDEADEDSNEEDYYRNDYPEDEDADEDMEDFHDAFDSEDEEREQDDSERDLWDYRD